MGIFSFFGGASKAATYPTDTIIANDGSEIRLTFFKHAALSIEVKGKYIYTDPVAEYAKYAQLPKADLVIITHSHYDHLDRVALDDLTTRESVVICDKTSAETFDFECVTMTPGMTTDPFAWLHVEARPAYNTTPDHQKFHPKEREDCGYLLTICGGTRIYIPGDTEDNEELMSLRNVDVLMLPVNQPYTMSVEQAVRAVKAIRPKIFYPIHYGEVEEKTDLERLCRELEGVTEVRIRPME